MNNLTKEKLFNNQLKKYGKRYSITKDDCNMYRILGELGQIEPYSINKEDLLSCWCYNTHDIAKGLTKRQCSAIVMAIKKFTTGIRYMDGEVDFSFDVKYLTKVAKIIKARKKRQLSQKQKIEQAERVKFARSKINRPIKPKTEPIEVYVNDGFIDDSEVSNG